MHIGRNIGRLRSFKGIKQQDMATRLKMTQQNYSYLENSENIEDEVLKRIAGILEYDVDYIKDMPEMPHVYNNNQHAENVINYQFNPIDKIVELYERMLQTEREKVALLEKLLDKGKK